MCAICPFESVIKLFQSALYWYGGWIAEIGIEAQCGV